jgi:hypothetical protein
MSRETNFHVPRSATDGRSRLQLAAVATGAGTEKCFKSVSKSRCEPHQADGGGRMHFAYIGQPQLPDLSPAIAKRAVQGGTFA